MNKTELLQKLLDYTIENKLYAGLCRNLIEMERKQIITKEERIFICNILEDNAPKEMYSKNYFFKPGDKEIRIDFLRRLI